MNKTFRLVWNVVDACWVAVAEHVRGRGKAAATVPASAALLAVLGLMPPAAAQTAPAPAIQPSALPTGGQVVAGQATIGQQGATLTVNQGSHRAAIDWATFNVGSQAQVRFEQPSSASVTLNRVNDANPSQIFGRISANGQVFLSNPSGVFFAPGASVDAAGLVATTHRISLDDFMAGRTRFERGAASGSVVNEGELRSALGGYIALLAPEVRNQGVIVANLGTVALAAGEAFELQFDANNTLAALRVEPGTIKALVDNRSAVLAPGGLVILSARALDQVQGGVVRHSGHIEASSLVNNGGRIVLEGDDITLAAGSRLDASGASGGGTVLVGGEWQGGGTMAQARTVTMESGASINASATQQGDGGTVVLWSDVSRSDSVTTAAGSIRARGGVQGGNGGKVETSGHQLSADGVRVDTLATQSLTGLWLLDPNAVTVAASGGTISGATIASNLNSTDVIIQTAATAVGDLGHIVINDNIAYTGSSARTLTFKAHNDIRLESGRTISSSTAPLNTVFRSRFNTAAVPDSGAVTLHGNVNTNGGGLWIGGGSGDALWTPYAGATPITVAGSFAATWTPGQSGVSINGATLNTGAGNIYMSGLEFPSALSAGVTSNGVRIFNSSITTTSGNIDITGDVKGAFDTGFGVYLSSDGGNTTLQTGSGAITITGTGSDNNTAGSGARHGVFLHAANAGGNLTLRSSAGAISLNGSASFTDARTTDTSGLQFQVNNTSGRIQIVSQTGDISLKGSNTQEASVNENAIRLTAADVANSIRIGFDGSTAYSGNILVEGNSLQQLNTNAGTGSISMQTTGGVTFQSAGNSFTQLRAGSGALSFDNDWNFGSTLGSFTFGRATNAANYSFTNALTTAGPITLYGGDINLNTDIATTAGASGEILLKARGSIRQAGGVEVRTQGAKVTYWADSDNNNVGGVWLDAGISSDRTGILSNGGDIVIGGGSDPLTDSAVNSSIVGGVRLDQYTTLNAGSGDISLRGSSTKADGNFGIGTFVWANSALNGRNISLVGSGSASSGSYTGNHGVAIEDGASLTASGTLTLQGTAGGSNTSGGSNHGVYLSSATLAGSSGVSITGTGGGRSGGGTDNDGVPMLNTSIRSDTGTLQITGTAGFGTSSEGIALGGAAAQTNQLGAAGQAGNIVLRADSLWASSTPQNQVLGNGTLTIEPLGTSFSTAFTTQGWSYANTLSGLTLGKAGSTAAITVPNALSINGPISLLGGDLNVSANLTSMAAGAQILLKSRGNTMLADGRALQTNGGAITLWADSDGEGTGYIQLVKNNLLDSRTATARTANVEASNLASATGGGKITLGGGSGASAADGYAVSNGTAQIGGVNLGGQADTANTTTMYSGGGEVVIRGRQTGSSAMGVQWINGGTINAGQGTVRIDGLNTGGGHGIELGAFRTGGDVRVLASGGNATTPAIDIRGSGTGSGSRGLLAQVVRLYSTGAGGITITGTANTGDRPGIDGRTTLDVLAASGPITLDGGSSGIEHVGSIGALAGTPVPSSSSNVTLTGNQVVFGGGGAAIRTTGTVTVQPFGSSFSSALIWQPANLNALASTVSGLTLGKEGNTANITVNSAVNIAGPVRVYGGNIAVNANLTSTAANASLLLKASGNIVVAANTLLTTNLGDLTLWSDSDASGQGYIAMDQGVRMNTLNGATSGTGGGRLTMAGGADTNTDGIPDGYARSASTDTAVLGSAHNPGGGVHSHAPAGVTIGFYEDTSTYTNDFRFYTGGGDVLIKGQSANGSPGIAWYGGYTGATQVIDAGAGSITLNGSSNTGHGIELNYFNGGSTPILRSASNAATAISITGATTAAGSSGYQGKAGFVASGSGGIDFSGTAMDNGKGVTGVLDLHAASGDIVITGTVNGTGTGQGISIGGSLGKGSGLASSSSDITLSADRIDFTSAESIDTTGTLTVQPTGTSFASALTWPLNNLTLAPTLSGLTLGKAGNTADITVTSAIGINGPIAVYGGNIALNAGLTATGSTVTLQGSGTVSDGASGFVAANNLLLLGGNVNLDNAGNTVATLAASGVGGLLYRNSGALTLGTVGATHGVSASGNVDIATTSGNLTVAQNVATTSASATALTLNAEASSTAGTATGGNLLISGSPSVSVGAGGTARLFSGSVAGSTGLTALVGSGSGRFRYNSDEAQSGYTLALDTGLNALYREKPEVQLAVGNTSMVYGDAVPASSLSLSGGLNGDTPAQAFSTLPTLNVGGTTSTSGHAVVGTHSVTATGGSGSSQLGYAVGSSSAGTLTVTPRPLLATFTGVNKDYDGSTSATLSISDDRIPNDVFTVGFTSADFASPNAGNGIGITVSGVNLTGSDAANYSVATSAGSSADINPKSVTVTGLVAAGKIYDGNTDVTITNWGSVATGVGSETLTLVHSGASASFDTATAGPGKTVTATGYTLANGSGLAGNYSLASTSAITTADIAKAVLTVTARDDAKFVIEADPLGFAGVHIAGFVAGETAAVLGGSPAVVRSNAGVDTAGVYTGVLVPDTNGLISDNYSFSPQNGSFTIVPADQLLVRVADATSVYGSAAAYSFTSAAYVHNNAVHNLALPGAANPDGSFTISDGAGATATFMLVPSAAALSGAGLVPVGSHTLAATGLWTSNPQNFSNTFSVVGLQTVTPKSVNVGSLSSVAKEYDGTTAMNGVHIAVNGLVAGDAVTASGNGAFNSKNAGTGLGYSISGITLAGNDAANYLLTGATSANGSDGVITPRPLDVRFTGVNKVYDGSTTASVTSTDDRIGGDQLDIGRSAVFADKNVGSGKTVTVTGLTLAGPDALNYTLASNTGEARADITRLDSVTWIGGASGNWFDPANWAGGAVPDLANVANVIIPAPAVVSFDPAAAVAPAQAGTVAINSLGSSGSLTQSGGTLDVGAGGITLGGFTQTGGSTSTQGNFTVNGPFEQGSQGSVAVGGNTSIHNPQGGVTLSNLASNGSLGVVSNGNIGQAGGTTVTVGGNTALDAGSGNVVLDGPGNNFVGPVDVRGHDVTLVDGSGGLTLGTVVATGSLTATSTGGAITQAPGGTVTVGGNTALDAGSHNVVLDGPGNNFVGPVDVRGGNVTLVDGSGGLTLGTVAATGSLTATSTGGAITQAPGSTVTVGGNTALDAGSHDVVLDGPGNNFVGPVDVRGNNVTLVDGSGGLTLGTVTAGGSLTATSSGGAITQTPSGSVTVGGNTRLDAGSSAVVLDGPGNNFVGPVDVRGGDVTLVDGTGGLTMGSVTAGGTLTVRSNGGDLTQAPGSAIQVQGSTTLGASTGVITLAPTGNQFAGGVTVTGPGAGSGGAGPDSAPTLPPPTLPQTLPTPSSAPPALGGTLGGTLGDAGIARGGATTEGVHLRLVPAVADQSAVLSVTVAPGLLPSGFSFVLPLALTEGQRADVDITATQADGSPLPTWLHFEREGRRFVAGAVPPGALPLRLAVTVGTQRTVIVLAAEGP